MTARRKSQPRSRECSPSVEPLEDRWLLSSLAPVRPLVHSQSVEVLEIGQPDQADNSARSITLAQLPDQVLAALRDRYPASDPVAAELDREAGETLFDVRLKSAAQELEVTLTPEGEVIEVQQAMPVDSVPISIRQWVEVNLPGVEVREVAIVTADGGVTYELSYETDTQQSYELTLRLADSSNAAGPVSNPVALEHFILPPWELNAAWAMGRAGAADDAAAVPADRVSEFEAELPAMAPPAVPHGAELNARQNQPGSHGQTELAGSAELLGPPVPYASPRRGGSATEGVPLALANASATPWLPQLAQVLGEVVTLDLSAIERRLREFLDEVDSMGDKVAQQIMLDRLTPRILAAAAACVASERLISRLRRGTRQSTVSASGDSTWIWVLGLAAPAHEDG